MSGLSDVFKTLLPVLGSALAGPLGGAAAVAIGNAIGLSNATQSDIAKSFSEGKLTPDQLASLKALELQYAAQEKELGFKYSELEFRDKDSARDMQKATQSAVPAVMTYLLTIGFFGVLGAMFHYPDVKDSPPLMMMLGSLGTAWIAACQFWFGTTRGSQNKDALLAQSPAKDV